MSVTLSDKDFQKISDGVDVAIKHNNNIQSILSARSPADLQKKTDDRRLELMFWWFSIGFVAGFILCWL